MSKLAELRQQRKAALDKYVTLADKDVLNDNEKREHKELHDNVIQLDDQIKRHQESQALLAAGGQPVGEVIDRSASGHWRVPASVEKDPYRSKEAAIERGLVTNKGLVVGGMMRMLGMAQRTLKPAQDIA